MSHPFQTGIGNALHIPGVRRKVFGTLDSGPWPIAGATISLKEYWYVMKPNESRELTLPHLQNTLRDGRSIELAQGRDLGEATISDSQDFVIEWDDGLMVVPVPWVEDMFLTDSSYNSSTHMPPLDSYPKVIAYRVLRLEVTDIHVPASGNWGATLQPVPLITFFDGEEEKNIGKLKLNVSPAN